MKHEINKENLNNLIETSRDDEEMLDMILSVLTGFEEYHRAIFEMESWLKLYNRKNMQPKEYQEKVAEMDKRRTTYHNAVIASVRILNRIAAQHDIPNIYDGEISEDAPYRRELADAVLGYIDSVIIARR